MKTLTATQMREADRRCIEELGIPGAVLMNTAGQNVFQEIDQGPVGIVCGKGNNGGDGFVVARLALLVGFEPQVVLLADPETIRGDAAIFLQAYQRLGGKLVIAKDDTSVITALAELEHCSVIVDALLGTGISGEVRGIIRTAIEHWPGIRTIAVDLPSGMNTDTGEPCGVCLRADVTVTFQFAKRGFENPTAQEYLGRLVVADIGIPEVCADDEAWARLMAEKP